jgi:hypothetical protein
MISRPSVAVALADLEGSLDLSEVNAKDIAAVYDALAPWLPREITQCGPVGAT